MKLRVCLVIPTLDQGGAEKQLCLLATGLDRNRFEPIVITLTRGGPREKQLTEAGIQVVHINKKAKIDPFAWRRLRSVLTDLKPDIVHTWLFAANAYGRSAALSAGVKTILGSERSVDPWKGKGQLIIDRWLASRTQGITCNSSAIADFYATHGIPRNNFEVIPNGVEPLRPRDSGASISREEAFKRMGIDPELKVVMSIGRLWPQKGYKDLIWSGELLRVLRGDVCYVIIGDGPERQRLEQYRDNIKAAARIFLLGHREDASDLLPHATLLWNGSLYEGQSNVILEAMQNHIPVIASDIPGNRDLVINKETGLLFPLGDVNQLTKITNDLLNDPARMESIKQKAAERVANDFSVSKMIERHESYYQSKVIRT